MHIPRHWATATAPAANSQQRTVTVKRWGWSDDSPAAAQAHADERLREALAHIGQTPGVPTRDPRSGYAGADALPIREEVLAQRGSALLTRNSYGAQCLNTPDALFADIDYPPATTSAGAALGLGLLSLLPLLACLIALWYGQWLLTALCALSWAALFALRRHTRASQASQQARDVQQQHESAITRVRLLIERQRGWGARLYRTPAGLRVLFTHAPFDPTSNEVADTFAALQADEVYRRMCQRQQCFRARVSGKPWRMGLSAPSWLRQWPVPAPETGERAEWLARYETAAAQHAACHFVRHLGNPGIHPSVQPVLDWHDELCGANSQRPLA